MTWKPDDRCRAIKKIRYRTRGGSAWVRAGTYGTVKELHDKDCLMIVWEEIETDDPDFAGHPSTQPIDTPASSVERVS